MHVPHNKTAKAFHSGGSVSGSYVPASTKRIGEVRLYLFYILRVPVSPYRPVPCSCFSAVHEAPVKVKSLSDLSASFHCRNNTYTVFVRNFIRIQGKKEVIPLCFHF